MSEINESLDTIVSNPFDGLITAAPWIAFIIILFSMYLLAKVIYNCYIIKKRRENFTRHQIKYIKLVCLKDTVFSALLMISGIVLTSLLIKGEL